MQTMLFYVHQRKYRPKDFCLEENTVKERYGRCPRWCAQKWCDTISKVWTCFIHNSSNLCFVSYYLENQPSSSNTQCSLAPRHGSNAWFWIIYYRKFICINWYVLRDFKLFLLHEFYRKSNAYIVWWFHSLIGVNLLPPRCWHFKSSIANERLML